MQENDADTLKIKDWLNTAPVWNKLHEILEIPLLSNDCIFQADVLSTYDRLFHIKYGYDSKLHRDDRGRIKTIGLSVQDEVYSLYHHDTS